MLETNLWLNIIKLTYILFKNIFLYVGCQLILIDPV